MLWSDRQQGGASPHSVLTHLTPPQSSVYILYIML